MKKEMNIFILKEAENALEGTLELKEYEQFNHNNKRTLSSTQRTFTMGDVMETFRKCKNGLVAGQYKINQDNADLYQYAYKPVGFTKGLEQFAIVIPDDIKFKYGEDEKLALFKTSLEDYIKSISIKPKKKKIKLQKHNKYKGTIGLALLTAATIGTCAAVIQKASEYQDTKERERFATYFNPSDEPFTTSQFQQMERENSLDEWDLRLNEQVEENEQLRKLP